MTIRDEYETLKTELVVKLTDTTVMCDFTFPFNFALSEEEENQFLFKGLETRRTTQRAMLIIDNTYRKCWLLPSAETAKDFSKIQNDILNDYKKKAIKAFDEESWRYTQITKDEFSKFIEEFIKRIKEASKPYIKKLETLSQEEVEKLVEEKEKEKTKFPIDVYKLD